MSLPTIPLDKIRGMLIGMCIGDALGAKYEEDFGASQYDPIIQGQVKVTVKEGYKSHIDMLPAGTLSDASEVPLELSRSLIVNPTYPWQRNNIITKYQTWSSQRRTWMSPEFYRYFKEVKTVQGYDKRWTEDSMKPLNKMLINESVLTRMIPLSLILNNQYGFQEAKLTHHEPHVIDASILYVNSLRLALWDVDISEINNKVKESTQHPIFRTVVNIGETGEICDISGVARTACFNLFYIMGICEAFSITSFQDAIQLIITQFPTGDIRYLSTLIGALYGASIGYDDLMLENFTSQNIAILRSNPELQDFDSLCIALKELSN